jgi:hypothetical protein
MRRIFLVAGLALAGCGDNHDPGTDDAVDHDAGAEPADAADDHDAAPPAVGPCLDRPTDLARPPTGQLPCDLLPPGFGP